MRSGSPAFEWVRQGRAARERAAGEQTTAIGWRWDGGKSVEAPAKDDEISSPGNFWRAVAGWAAGSMRRGGWCGAALGRGGAGEGGAGQGRGGGGEGGRDGGGEGGSGFNYKVVINYVIKGWELKVCPGIQKSTGNPHRKCQTQLVQKRRL